MPINAQQPLPNVWSIFAALVVTLMVLLAGVFGLHFYYDYQAEQTRLNSYETLTRGS